MKRPYTFYSIPWVTVGQVLGVLLIIPLCNYLINRFYYGKVRYNTNTELYYRQYVSNSDTIRIILPEYGSKHYKNNDVGLETLSFILYQDKGMMDESLHTPTISFYDIHYKKYFIIMSFGDYSYDDWCGKEVKLWVNKEDLNNPEYGTKDNPVPVLQAQGVKSSIRANNRDYDTTYMDSFYRNNVIRYLKYKMSKEEFERRFKHKE